MAKKDEAKPAVQEQSQDIIFVKKRLDMLDQRLDNIDSMVTAVAERVMTQPVTMKITCSKCGQNIEIAIIGTEKPGR